MLNIVGHGALGDSVILYAKIWNIIRNLPCCVVNYRHFESNKKTHYKKTLEEFWQLVSEIFNAHGYKFNFSIEFYPHREFYQHVPQKMNNKGIFLTTEVDFLCYNRPNIIAMPQDVPLVIIADGGGGSRGASSAAIEELCKYFNMKSVILGSKKIHLPHIEKMENLTGATTLEEALGYIGGAELVIGPDGILTYYAFLQRKKNIILFHEKSLINHYWSDKLKRPSIALHQEGWLKNAKKVIEVSKTLI